MRNTHPKRIAAALALATGLTLFGGIAAQADTNGVASNATSSVDNVTPMVAPGIKGPYPARFVCEIIRKNSNLASNPCFETAIAWYFTTK